MDSLDEFKSNELRMAHTFYLCDSLTCKIVEVEVLVLSGEIRRGARTFQWSLRSPYILDIVVLKFGTQIGLETQVVPTLNDWLLIFIWKLSNRGNYLPWELPQGKYQKSLKERNLKWWDMRFNLRGHEQTYQFTRMTRIYIRLSGDPPNWRLIIRCCTAAVSL